LTSIAALTEHQFDFIAGEVCLDFANTFGGLPAESSTQERLTDYPRLVAWSHQASLINEHEAHMLLHNAEHAPAEASAILERALALRQAITRIFAALAYASPPTTGDLDVLNRELERGMAGAQVVMTPAGFDWTWRTEEGALDSMLGPVARSAAMLLTGHERQFVRECANDLCHWLFVDTTKNHRRRWCRTTGCGNMMRVRKHRDRHSHDNPS
jgi:predicted RNA-binding Zn ribbon-like protein